MDTMYCQDWYDLFRKYDIERKRQVAMDKVYLMKKQGYTVYPEVNEIFTAFSQTDYTELKVIILGQDPYYKAGQACGLAFSVKEGLTPTLRNIFKELYNDLGGPLRTNGNLEDWANQGVLLLNTALTVIDREPNSMKNIWGDFIDDVLKILNNKVQPIVFVLWGKNAIQKRKIITNQRHYIIESAHPSPLSANKGFWGSKPFSKTNNFLQYNGRTPIKW